MVYTKLEKTDMKILGHMVKGVSREYSMKELADQLETPYVKIHSSIQRLANKNIIKKRVLGKSHYCSFDYKNNLDVACFTEAQRARDFADKNRHIKIFFDNVQENLAFPDYSLAIFGSYAKKTQTKNSDLDLAVITEKGDLEKAERTINALARTSNMKIHVVGFTYNDLIEMLKSKELTVGKEIINGHIILHGCEQLYECIRLSE